MTTKAAHPKLTPVDSSAMKAAHYDPQTGSLYIQFTKGDVWHYGGVSLERGTSFMDAASKGRYYAKEIKPHHIGEKVA